MNLTPTEIEELRIAIAEEVGWKFGDGKTSAALTAPDGRIINNHFSESWRLPDYPASIDAIQAAALVRFNESAERILFPQNLDKVSCENENHTAIWPWQLTALDWCIAFARTAKIWRYK